MIASDLVVMSALETRYCAVILGAVKKYKEIYGISFCEVISVHATLKEEFS